MSEAISGSNVWRYGSSGCRCAHPGYAMCLFLRNLLRFAALAGDADLVAVGEAVGRGYDDAVVGRDAGGELDVAPEVAGNGHRLELDLVVRIDGGDPKPALVEDQRAGGNMQRHLIALQAELHIGVA